MIYIWLSSNQVSSMGRSWEKKDHKIKILRYSDFYLLNPNKWKPEGPSNKSVKNLILFTKVCYWCCSLDKGRPSHYSICALLFTWYQPSKLHWPQTEGKSWRLSLHVRKRRFLILPTVGVGWRKLRSFWQFSQRCGPLVKLKHWLIYLCKLGINSSRYDPGLLLSLWLP